jgi:hypothetical protein
MRSTAFDMIGMTLMAVAVVLVTGGVTFWRYLVETRGSSTQDHEAATAPDGSSDAEEPRVLVDH